VRRSGFGTRAWRTLWRTAHLISFGALYGGHVYDVAGERLLLALLATIASGVALVALELRQSILWLVQVRGVATLGKVLLVSSVAIRRDWAVPILTVVIAIGAVSSHMPGRLRYYSLVHRRVVGPQERG